MAAYILFYCTWNHTAQCLNFLVTNLTTSSKRVLCYGVQPTVGCLVFDFADLYLYPIGNTYYGLSVSAQIDNLERPWMVKTHMQSVLTKNNSLGAQRLAHVSCTDLLVLIAMYTRFYGSRVASTCFFHLRRLRSLHRQLGRDVTTRLVSALVLSRLDYCNAILVGLPQTTLSLLQRVLRVAARMVLNLRPCDHVTSALLQLHWLPIAKKIQFKLCLLVHKALVGRAPQYISDLIRPVADLPSRASSRSALSGNLFLPRTRRKLRDRAFAVTASRVWNGLPTDIRLHQSTTTSFKRRLKTVLFNRGFAEHM